MEAIHNFRDFGGYKTQHGLLVKKGLLYRSGSLDKTSNSDLKRLASLGIKTVCDLRTHKEREQKPDRIFGNSDIKSIQIPIKVKKHDESGFVTQLFSLLFGEARRLDFNRVSREVYQEFTTDFRTEFSEIVKLAAESSNLPMLIHCTAGKDRTGFACSLIHLILGLPLELVMHDYLLTNNYLSEFKVEMLNKLKIFSVFGVPRNKFLPLFDARTDYLNAAFDQMQHDYGSVEDYIRNGLGISDVDKLRLNDILLENPNIVSEVVAQRINHAGKSSQAVQNLKQ